MKAIILLCSLVLKFSLGFAQTKKTWVTYFPVQTNAVGKLFQGKPNDVSLSDTDYPIEGKLEEVDSYTYLNDSLTKELQLGISSIFKTHKIVIQSIIAKGIKIVSLTPAQLIDMPKSQKFVFKGLKADEVYITYRHENNLQLNPIQIVKTVLTQIPNTDGTVVSNLVNQLTKDSLGAKKQIVRTDTIKNPNVFFMIQVAEFKQDTKAILSGKTGMTGKEVWTISSFGSLSPRDKEIAHFTLNENNPQSDNAYSRFSKKDAHSYNIQTIPCWLSLDDKCNLFLNYRRGNTTSRISKAVELKPTSKLRWLETGGMYFYRYPIGEVKKAKDIRDGVKYKEMILYYDVTNTSTKDNCSVSVYNKRGEKDYPTRIEYPQTIFDIIEF
jgi:hypothetical protein